MFLLLDSMNKIIYISKSMEKSKDEFGYDIIKVSPNLYYQDEGYSIIEVETVPIEVIPEKYFYIDGEYVLNPNYIDDSMIAEYEQRVSTLQEMTATLEESIDELTQENLDLTNMAIDLQYQIDTINL